MDDCGREECLLLREKRNMLYGAYFPFAWKAPAILNVAAIAIRRNVARTFRRFQRSISRAPHASPTMQCRRTHRLHSPMPGILGYASQPGAL
ncbi:hypothetical protein PCAR4_1220003 [Paraburkholderia caribensis]|nr:hypothetical protein PCAR4_1220003 [Paraburkholderia caribensis]